MLSQKDSNIIYEGLVDDFYIENWPAPLKIVHQTMQSMKEFRVCIKCNRLGLKNRM